LLLRTLLSAYLKRATGLESYQDITASDWSYK